MFNIVYDGDKVTSGYQYIKCHMIFDIKTECFRRKSMLVSGGHIKDVPPTMRYAVVVSRETL